MKNTLHETVFRAQIPYGFQRKLKNKASFNSANKKPFAKAKGFDSVNLPLRTEDHHLNLLELPQAPLLTL